MRALRSVLYPLRLVGARLGRRSAPVVLVVLGIAAGASVVLGGRAGSLVAQDRALAQAIERIPEGSRSVRAVWFGVPGQSDEPQPVLERRARTALAHATPGAATSLVLFRETTIAGSFSGLGGVEGLGSQVALRSGRLPRECRPERCEVIRLRGDGRLPQPDGLRLVEVGRASLESRLLFGDFLAPTDNALADAEVSPVVARAAGYHRPPPPPLFLAEGVRTLAGAPALDSLYRSYAWVVPVRPGRPRLWQVDELAAGVTRARSELQGVTTSFDLVAPVEELRVAQASSKVAGRRLGIVGGEAAALLFAFALLAAMTLRTDLGAARRRLAWYGARGWQLALLTTAEAGALALAGSALGLAVGAVGGALVAERAGAPVGAILERSALSAEGLGLSLLVAVAATAILVGAVAARRPRLGRAGFTLLDAAAAAAIAVVGLELARGDGTGDLVLLLPALVTFAAAVAVSRMLRPSLRLFERLARRRSIGLRLASLSLARNPGYAVAATAFLVVSFGLALFAESYRSTLSEGERDQAAFRVPLDFAVRQDLRRLIPVQDAASLEQFRALGGGVQVEPVLRLTGSVARLEGESGITLLGLSPRTFPELGRLGGSSGQVIRGRTLPAGVLQIPVAGPITATANLLTARGRFLAVQPGELVPAGSRLVALTLAPDTRIQERGADAAQALRGTALVGPVEVGGTRVPGVFRSWTGVGGADVTELYGGSAVRIEYTLTGEQVTRLRPRQPTDEHRVTVLATPRVAAAAAADGSLPLQVGGERVSVTVVGTLERFPTVPGEAVVGDRDSLLTLLNTSRPGAARVDEVWLGAGSDSAARELGAALSRPPFHVLAVESRRALEAEARRDPIAHGTLLALAIAAAVALGLALAGILLTVLGDLRDERGELFDLEAQGASPALLRRIVRLRALTVTLAGLVGGALAGVALAAIVTDLVGLTARATAPQPPLAVDVDALVIAAAAALYVLVAGALVLAATRRAFSASHPARVEVQE